MFTSLVRTHLVLERSRLHHLQGSAVHLDQAIPPLAVGNCCGSFLQQKVQMNTTEFNILYFFGGGGGLIYKTKLKQSKFLQL